MKEKSSIKKDIYILSRLIKIIWNLQANFIPLTIVQSIVKTAIPIVNIILPKYIIDEMIGLKRWNHLIFYILIIILSNAVLAIAKTLLDKQWNLANIKLRYNIEKHLNIHIMNMDFEKIENPQILDLKDRALYPIKMQSSLNELIQSLCDVITIIITLISVLMIILQAGILLLIILIISSLLNIPLLKKSNENFSNFYSKLPVTMRKSMYFENISTEYKFLKDIQIYDGSLLLLDKLKDAHQDNIELFNNVFKKNGHYEGVLSVFSHVQLIFIYIYFIYELFLGRITFGSFTMYINASLQFANNMKALFDAITRIRQNCKYFDVYIEFLDIKSKNIDGTLKIKDINNVCIEFRNVFFHYPNQKNNILKDISVTISPREKLSIVGLNGAGKTTFIKLLCRLYSPTKGCIYLNGINIEEYSYDEYMNIISAVFQDFKLFSFSFKENIKLGAKGIDVRDSIIKAGLEEKIERCEKGIDTPISKQFDKSGIELSGGEAQKLAIARAIYKNSPLMILDEPTSALDPYTEYEIYKKFDEISKDKTVLYVSHRLSSCLLCDRILVFDKGEIVEQGTHKELKEKDGQYKVLWDAQAQYYVEEKGGKNE